MTRSIIYILVSVLFLGTMNSCAFKAPSNEKPNVIIVLTDDQGWGDVGFNGNKIINTPALDSLSAVGVVMDRFYVSPVCAPTRASILTGKYNLATGTSWVTHRKEVMRESEITIAEVLKNNGYSTAYFGKWHNGAQYPHNPLGQGFEHFFGFSAGHWNNYFDTDLEYNGNKVSTKGYISDVITDSTIAYIENSKQPFLAFVAYNTPHTPYQVPDKYFDKYIRKGLDKKTAAIYGMCENIDDNVLRLQNALNENQKCKNTVFIFLSDNGPNYVRYNGGLKGRKAQVDEGGVRVPFIFNYPNSKTKSRKITQGFGAHIDLFPTILELCNIAIDTLNIDGVSLAKVFTGDRTDIPDREFYSHHIINKQSFSGSVRSNDYLLTCYPNDTALYNLKIDPYQINNIIAENQSLTDSLIDNYNKWLLKVTSKGLVPEPIHVGHAIAKTVELPAHESKLGANAKFAGGMGWANDWVINWKDTSDFMNWTINVTKPGTYKVSMFYTCNNKKAHSKFNLQCQNNTVDFEIEKAIAKEIIESPDRIKRDEVYEINWGVQSIGELNLDKGICDISLKYNEIKNSGIEIKGLEIYSGN